MRLPDPRRLRMPAVAGFFYPAAAAQVADLVSGYLEAAGEPPAGPAPEAVIAPHAGYVYSGPVAGFAFAALKPRADAVRRVVLLGPAHRVPLDGLALPESGVFETPLGRVPVDRDGARKLAALPQVSVSEEPHLEEHSLEVELPFLQAVLGEFELLPLVVGSASAEAVAEALERAWDGPETVIVVSSDLSHYLPYDVAREVDRASAEQILALEGTLSHDQACGATPINGLLAAARRRSLAARLLDLRNSGDTAGDKDRVVGYGAFAFVAGSGDG